MHTPPLDDFAIPGAGAHRSGWAAWPPPARAAVIMGSSCLGLVLLQWLVLWGILALMFNSHPPEGLIASIQPQGSAVVGRKLPVTLTVRNNGARPFSITAVTLPASVSRSLHAGNPQPPPRQTERTFGITTWSYEKTVPPGGTWSLRFEITPAEKGANLGHVSLQFGIAQKSVPFSITAGKGEGGKGKGETR